jgi:seryl-tRNA synthetase
MAKENIYEFTINKSEKQKVEVNRKNKETGEVETVLQNKTVKTPVNFIVNKPTRRTADEAEIHYSVQLSKAIKMGIVTKAMLVKKYADNGGALSEEESKELLKSLKKLHDLENEYKLVVATKDKKQKARENELELEISTLRREMISLESSLQSVYQHTADAKAERETLLWYVINLSKVKNADGEIIDWFEGMDFEEKLEDFYDKYELEEGFDFEVVSKLSKVVGFWFYSQDSSQESIAKFVEEDE